MNIPSTIITMLVGICLTLVSLWYGQNNHLLPIAASSEAAEIDGLFNAMMTVATGLFILVQGGIIYSMIRFRQRKGDETDGPPTHGNIALEVLWTAIPAVTVLIISIYSFEIYNKMGGLDPMASHDHSTMQAVHHHQKGEAIAAPLDEMNRTTMDSNDRTKYVAIGVGASPENEGKPADLNVNINGLQYAWIFNYPDLGISSGELHLILNKEAQLNIVAQDVIHALWLPEFRLKQDAIPGRTTELRFVPRKTGQFAVVCAELCGGYHGSMRTQLIVQTPEEFDAWVASQKAVATQDNLRSQIAQNPANLSNGEYLAPYAAEMGITQQTLAQLKSAQLTTIGNM